MYRRLNMLAAYIPLPFLFTGSKQVDAVND
jgi:hypothetical protein